MFDMNCCELCPRRCRSDRTVTVGFCGAGDEVRAAKTMLHFWEEPCVSGTRGSGAIFFEGCPLRCVFCQNMDISRRAGNDAPRGDTSLAGTAALADAMTALAAAGAHNLNLVSPTQYTPQIIEALELARPAVPVVWNTGGYERRETIAMLRGYADVFLTDVKYLSPELSARCAGAPDYFETAADALEVMLDVAGAPEYDGDGMMRRGVIVRVLVLPGERRDAEAILRALYDRFGADAFVLSLMSQYTPEFFLRTARASEPELKALRRRVTTFEYQSVADFALSLGFRGYFQERSSASASYTPDFGSPRDK